MFSRLFKILIDSVSSVTKVNQWENISKDLVKSQITGYSGVIRTEPTHTAPKYKEGQLVTIRYHHKWPHLHKEVGIVLQVTDYTHNQGLSVNFYEVLVGEQRINLIERYLDECETEN